MKMRRLCAYIMALLLAASMPLSAVAAEYDLVNGSIEINAPAEGGQTVSQGGSEGVSDSAPVITQSGGGSTSNSVTINADAGSTANVTLSGVNIDTSGTGGAAVEIKGGGNVTIELDGNNTVKSDRDHAGVEKTDENSSGRLTITDDNEKSGTLIATGGNNAAGIGGDGIDSENAGMSSNITISGGTVVANGGTKGAGIGGGRGGNGSNITISGGNVTATGGADAAGIGGGSNGNGSNITISGGTVDATGGIPQEISDDKAVGGGAGIGGGAYGTSDNITVKYNAQVTAEGKGNAANIGNGYASEATEQQEDKVDLSGLSSFGNVNGVSGSDGGFHASNGSSSSGGSTGGGNGNLKTVASYRTWTDVAADLGKITASDNDGNALGTVVWLNEEDTLKVTAPANNVLVTGNKADLLQLKEDGVKQINLQTNRVNVSVTNELLQKITGTGGGFRLSTDNTTVNLTATDQNNKKTLDMTLTANKQSGTQAAPDQSSIKPEITIDTQSNTGNSIKTLQVSTNAPEATLSYNQKYLQPLLANSELRSLALAVGNVIATVDGMLGTITAQNGSGSITIGNNTVNMNGIQFSAADSSENNKLDDVLNEIRLKMENKAQGGSTMAVEVNAKAAMASASLKVPESALQSLMDQGIEETALSVNGKTTSFKNSNLQKQIEDSPVELFVEMVDVGGSQLPFVNFRTPTDIQ